MLKRRFDGKTIGSLFILMMMVCLSAFAGLRSDDVWTLNPSDFRYDMSLYFTVGSKDFEDLEAYEIGAFIGDECRGIAEKIELPEGGSYLYMRIRSNQDQPDEAVTFFARDKKTGKTVSLKGDDGGEFLFKPDTMVGLPSTPFVLIAYYDVTVKAGEHGSVDFTDGSYAVGTVLKFEAVADEGYHFVSWSDGVDTAAREITVSDNIDLTASFAVSSFKVTFKIGDEVIEEKDVEFGTEIKTPVAAEKEGYTFAGWGEVPATMPAKDLTFEGSYTINSYKLTFKIGDEVIDTKDVEFGAQIAAPEAPEKEGYTFAGWGEVPATMPAKDVEIVGAYNVNSYKLTFKIGDEVIETKEVNFGAEIKAPEAPAKEGYTFAGWGEVPATMPAKDLTFEGSYTINSYKLTFKIGDEVIDTKEVEFGAEIKAPQAPEKEGYTFAGWGEVPATMPAKDVEIAGAYNVNSYKLTFKIGDEVIETKEVNFGAEIKAPEAPAKEGYTFSGWGEVPASMPAKDLEFAGAYTVNSYKLTFKIGDEVIETKEVNFGAEIKAPEAPAKEGYTFAGWGEVPATMPAKDVEIVGAYNVNSYKLTFKIGDEIIESKDVEFGAEIVAPEAPEKDGYLFDGWSDFPETMPAHDLVVTGTMSVDPNAAVNIIGVDADENVTVYTLNGRLLFNNVKAADVVGRLTPGLYIINGKKVMVK
ncbi:MAG: InlB B-repeat-containing protein [Bacteroides sp.]|nr:InlB B-repeat-containing protein [Bacteroides sp.]